MLTRTTAGLYNGREARPQNSPRVERIDVLSPPRRFTSLGEEERPLTEGRNEGEPCIQKRDAGPRMETRKTCSWTVPSGDEIAVNNRNKRARCSKKWQEDSRRIGLVSPPNKDERDNGILSAARARENCRNVYTSSLR